MPKKMTHDEFVQRVNKERNGKYEVLGKYINFRTKVLVRHVCGNEYEITPANLLHYKTQCRKCFVKESGKKRSHGLDGFMSKLQGIYGYEYKILGEYKNVHTKILVEHQCGYQWEAFPSNLLRGNGCPKCAGNKRKTHNEFVREVHELVGDEYLVLGEFKNVEEKILMKHNVCGYEWMVRPSHFTANNRRCPKCIESSGEKIIEEVLSELYCDYERQYRFEDCRHKNPLPFDFAVKIDDHSMILIEYDGIQHFKTTGGWGTTKQLKITQKRDKIKNEYCNKNNIPLIRIPYWEKDNIEDILNKELLPKLNQQCVLAL